MAYKLIRQRKLMLGIETTYGTPAAAMAAVLAMNPEFSPAEGQDITREIDQAHFGSRPSVRVGEHQTLSCDLELTGAGNSAAPQTIPAWADAVRPCGVTITQGVGDVTFNPVTTPEGDSVSIQYWEAQDLHTLTGVRGSCRFTFEANSFPRIGVSYTGLVNAAAGGQAEPVGDYSAFTPPDPTTVLHVASFSLFGQAGLGLSRLEITGGQQVTHRALANQEAVLHTDRTATASVTIDSPGVDVYDFFALIRGAKQTGAVSLTHGTAAGKRVAFSAPQTQITSIRMAEADGIRQLTLELALLPDTGDDEWSLVTS